MEFINSFLSFLPILIRVSSIVFAIPMLNIAPMVIRIGLAFWISIAISKNFSFQPDNLILVGIIKEIILALIIYAIFRIFFLPPQFAGELLGFQIGFGIQGAIVPTTELQLTLLADFFYILSLVLFFSLDLHLDFIWGIKASFELSPPLLSSPTHINEKVFYLISQDFLKALQASIMISAPVLLAVFIIEIMTAIISKGIPQFNIFIVGFPIKIAVGIILLSVTIDRIGYLIGDFIKGIILSFSDALKILRF